MEKEFVEIAGIKWATKNVGAEKETDAGFYFQWGDTQGYTVYEIGRGEDEKIFNWESYKYGSYLSKYNKHDGNTVLEAPDDAVTAAWGNSWRMPTKEEYDALCNAVNVVWTNDYKDSGVAGIVCTDKTDSSKVLFFPECGYCYNSSVLNAGYCGYYWSSSLYSNNVRCAFCLRFFNGLVCWQHICSRNYGLPIRAVLDDKSCGNQIKDNNKNKKIAFYPGSFDPFHKGHEYIVQSALNVFDEVIIGISVNTNKTPFIPFNRRFNAISKLYENNDRVKVALCKGLTALEASKFNATAIIKGVRNVNDFSDEMTQADCNMFINKIPTFFIPSKKELSHISSTLIRTIYENKDEYNKDKLDKILEEIICQNKK